MSHQFTHLGRPRAFSPFIAFVILCISALITSSIAQGRIDPLTSQPSAPLLGTDTVAIVTGGGTVYVNPLNTMGPVASFGLNAKRPNPYTPGSADAQGRINYDRHISGTGRHVNVPVAYMQAVITFPPSPNGTGGAAAVVGDCRAANSECPSGFLSVLVYAEDDSDNNSTSDTFKMFFCITGAQPPPPDFDGSTAPSGCDTVAPEGGPLRSGNIQIRGNNGVDGETIGTAAGSGAYSSTPNVNGVELAGGTFGVGVRTGGAGDLEAQLNGVNPMIGLFQKVTVTGWISSATVQGNTLNLSGTGALDMGDGTLPLTGLALSGSISSTGVTLTVGSWSFGTLPMADGFIKIE
jgi:hypothetical protein